MFISPVNSLAKDYPPGWAVICDMVFRMPLNIFVKLVCLPYDIPELEEYLKHPIRRYYRLKQLPPHLRSCLLFKRRYIFALHDSLLKLCYMGLVQFGPQRLKEKDQQYIYLNRKALIVDTRNSDRGYNQVAEQDYPVTSFDFTTYAGVEKYWHELWNVCMNTYLGMRVNLKQSTIVVECADTKPILVKYTQHRRPDEAPQLDVGYMPGNESYIIYHSFGISDGRFVQKAGT